MVDSDDGPQIRLQRTRLAITSVELEIRRHRDELAKPGCDRRSIQGRLRLAEARLEELKESRKALLATIATIPNASIVGGQ